MPTPKIKIEKVKIVPGIWEEYHVHIPRLKRFFDLSLPELKELKRLLNKRKDLQ